METANTKRYVAHDFSIGSPVLVDCVDKTMTFYDHNIHGQIYNLNKPQHHAINTKKINGLIRRLNGNNYSFANSFSADSYIYKYIMTPEQQARCSRKPEIASYEKLIVATDDKSEAIKAMCAYVYEHTYPKDLGDKDAERSRLLQYCDNFLAAMQAAQAPKAQASLAVERKKADRGGR
jgi:hypothetical protein